MLKTISKSADILEYLKSVEMPDGCGYGSRLSSGLAFINYSLDRLVGEVKIFNPEAALPGKGRSVILLTAHGGILGPTPMMAALGRMYIERGFGDQTIGFYTHWSIQKVPWMRTFFEKIGALYKIPDINDLAARLKSGEIRIAGTALEGAYCAFTWEEPVGPFQTGGMIAAAILSGSSVCLLTHQGTDPWHLQVNLPSGLTVPMTRGLRGLNIPIGPVRKIERLKILCRRYKVGVKKDDYLSKMDRGERHTAIGIEMGAIRDQLIRMTAELKELN